MVLVGFCCICKSKPPFAPETIYRHTKQCLLQSILPLTAVSLFKSLKIILLPYTCTKKGLSYLYIQDKVEGCQVVVLEQVQWGDLEFHRSPSSLPQSEEP